MALKKRVEILFEPDKYSYLEDIARRRKTSVGKLIREAVEKTYLDADMEKRLEAVERLISANLDLGDWEDIKKDLEESRYQDTLKSMGGEITV